MNARLFASRWRGLLLLSLIMAFGQGTARAEDHPNTVGVTVSITSGPATSPAALDEQVTAGLSATLDDSQVSQEAKNLFKKFAPVVNDSRSGGWNGHPTRRT